MATPSAENSSSTAEDRKAMRSTFIVRWRRSSALARNRRAVACTLPRARSVGSPRSRSSRKAFMLLICSHCASLAARARQPTSTMNSGMRGAAVISTAAAAQLYHATGSRISRGMRRTRHMAPW